MGKPKQNKRQANATPERLNLPSFFGTGRMTKAIASKKHKKAVAGSELFKKEILELLGAKMDPSNYIPAREDRPELVRVKPVSILGDKQYGLFASKPIKPGTLLGRYTGKRYSKTTFRRHLELEKEATPNYAMETDSGIICAEEMGNFTRFANCSSSQPNTAFVALADGGAGLKVIRPIAMEEQVLVDYNGPCDQPGENPSQLFLNPQDGALSTAELLFEFNRHYSLEVSSKNYSPLGVCKGDSLYITRLIRYLMENRPLDTLRHFEPTEVNLLCLKTNKTGIVKPAAQDVNNDPFTPLMLACYLGQLKNVQFLIQNGAEVNHQQNLSGKCPLFFALDGYSETINGHAIYLEIILELLRRKALISVHDSEDKTFLHKASLILQPTDLKIVLGQLAKMGAAVKEQFELVDKHDQDIVIVCLAERKFDNLAVLLKYYPSYFGDQFLPPIKGRKKNSYAELISDTLKAYTPEEAHNFFVSLRSARIAKLDLSPLDDLRSTARAFVQTDKETKTAFSH